MVFLIPVRSLILGKVVLSLISIAEKQRIITYFRKGTISFFRVNLESETNIKISFKGPNGSLNSKKKALVSMMKMKFLI